MVVTVRHGSKIKLRDLCGYIYNILPDYTSILDMKSQYGWDIGLLKYEFYAIFLIQKHYHIMVNEKRP